jgi:hypothetical protein
MLKEKRKATRREMHYSAWIALEPDQLLGCAMSDVSETGARIDVEDAKIIPDHFTLFLSRAGTPKRKCSVVWRNGNQIGVEFERIVTKLKPFRKKSAPEAKTDDANAPALVPDTQPEAAETDPA